MKMQILIFLFFVLFPVSVLSPQTIGITEDMIIQIKKTNNICQLKNSEFTPIKLMEYLKLRDIENPLIVYKQAVLETGWFKSGSFTEYSNLFGMKVPKIRDNLVKGSGYGHSIYNHWTESVDDFIMWQKYWKSEGHNLNNYYSFLIELPYAIDRNYVKKLQRLII